MEFTYVLLVALSIGLHLYVLRWGFEYLPVICIILLPVFYADFFAKPRPVSILRPSSFTKQVSIDEEPEFEEEEEEENEFDNPYIELEELEATTSQMKFIAKPHEPPTESTPAETGETD